jgi:hypothetical protein
MIGLRRAALRFAFAGLRRIVLVFREAFFIAPV